MTYEESKGLPRRNASDKVFLNKAFDIAEIQNKMDIKVMVLK